MYRGWVVTLYIKYRIVVISGELQPKIGHCVWQLIVEETIKLVARAEARVNSLQQ